MKKSILTSLLFVFVTLSFTSCLDGVNTQQTPYCCFSYFYKNPIIRNDSVIAASDTIWGIASEDTEKRLLDTIRLQDSVYVAVAFCSDYNNLTRLQIYCDTSVIRLSPKLGNDPLIRSLLQPGYILNPMDLQLNPACNLFIVPLVYRPLKAGTHSIAFSVTNDATKVVSVQTYTFSQTVIE